MQVVFDQLPEKVIKSQNALVPIYISILCRPFVIRSLEMDLNTKSKLHQCVQVFVHYRSDTGKP